MGPILEKEKKCFYANYPTLGKAAQSEFYETRFNQKSQQLLDNITKTRKRKKKEKKVAKHDLNKETVEFLCFVD